MLPIVSEPTGRLCTLDVIEIFIVVVSIIVVCVIKEVRTGLLLLLILLGTFLVDSTIEEWKRAKQR